MAVHVRERLNPRRPPLQGVEGGGVLINVKQKYEKL